MCFIVVINIYKVWIVLEKIVNEFFCSCYTMSMKNREKFPYDIDFGAIMDFVENHFMLVIKDEEWTDEELKMIQQGCQVHFCYTQDIAIFVLEGGDIDSSDFYFNVQECDWKDELFKKDVLDIELILVDKENEICYRKRKTLSKDQSQLILDKLQKQNQVQFGEGEYDMNVEGIQSAYEPYELNRYSIVEIKM